MKKKHKVYGYVSDLIKDVNSGIIWLKKGVQVMSVVQFIKNNQEYFEDFITRSVYHSNAIEGNTMSYAETYAIVFNDNSMKINAEPREIYEAINLKYAMSYMLDSLDDDLSEALIKRIAILINKNINNIAGYRNSQVMIRGAEFIPPQPNEIGQKMMYLLYNYHNTQFTSIYEKVAFFHIQFERIHPFNDGNGRSGRVLINYELLKNDLPPVIISKDDKAKYIKYLAEQDINGLADYLKKLSVEEGERINRFRK